MKLVRIKLFAVLMAALACTPKENSSGEEGSTDFEKAVPVIGFMDAFEDETVKQAKKGFFDALKSEGYSKESGTLEVLYRNAQGDIGTLIEACDYFVNEGVDLIAANTSVSAITAVQKTSEIPICMMVAPSPKMVGVTDDNKRPPENLFGVFDTQQYIATSLRMIQMLMPSVKRIGVVYNQAEPQSTAALDQIKHTAAELGIELFVKPVNSSSDAQLVVQSMMGNKLDAFFALPDNVVFSSFEAIYQICSEAEVPLFTSEQGLVKRGAVAAYGADMYEWGMEAGKQAAVFLKNERSLEGLKPVKTKSHIKVYNPEEAEKYGLKADSTFKMVSL